MFCIDEIGDTSIYIYRTYNIKCLYHNVLQLSEDSVDKQKYVPYHVITFSFLGKIYCETFFKGYIKSHAGKF